MPYDTSKLQAADPTDIEWGLAWVRHLLRDTAAPYAWQDAELYATLQATAWQHEGTTYYRPHEAAAQILETDPDRPLAESTLGASVTNRDARQLAAAMRRAGAWVNDLIADAAGTRPPSRRTLEVVW